MYLNIVLETLQKLDGKSRSIGVAFNTDFQHTEVLCPTITSADTGEIVISLAIF